MLSKWDYIGYYFGLMILTFMLVGLVILGVNTLKSIWNRRLIEHFKELLEWNKRSFFFLYGLLGMGIYKMMKIIFPVNWTIKIISVIYCLFSLTLILSGLIVIYVLITDFYFFPTREITEIYKEFK
jgi:hypothetical protein